MEIKRNIFNSSARSQRTYDNVATPLEVSAPGAPYLVRNPAQLNLDVRHAPCPRIGEKN